MKYLVLLVVLVVAFGIWRSRRATDAASAPAPARRALGLPEDMRACAHCGVHVPQAEVVQAGSHAYCCAEHQRLGPT